MEEVLLPPRMERARSAGLAGKQHQPRDIANACYRVGWVNAKQLTICVAVMLAESQGFDRAWHDNLKTTDKLTAGQVVCNVETLEKFTCVDSNDGIMKSETGITDTFPLTVEWIVSRDVGAFQINIPASAIGTPQEETLYDFTANVASARNKWLTWSGDGKNTEVGWDHWSAYSSGIALDPMAAGKYVEKACRGVGNFLADQIFHVPNPPLLYYAGGSKYPL